jgi:hypothetical protein
MSHTSIPERNYTGSIPPERLYGAAASMSWTPCGQSIANARLFAAWTISTELSIERSCAWRPPGDLNANPPAAVVHRILLDSSRTPRHSAPHQTLVWGSRHSNAGTRTDPSHALANTSSKRPETARSLNPPLMSGYFYAQ